MRDELTPNIYFQIAFQVSRAVSFLASKNLIHADLHIGNILVKEYQNDTDTEFGNIQLVLNDFEYLTDCLQGSRDINSLEYSLPSRPPEDTISPGWDVWCLGQTLYQIITGEVVKFQELSDEEIRSKIFNHPKIRKSCLSHLIFCCLQRKDRISAKCFLEALICEWYSWLDYTKKLKLMLKDKKLPHHLIIRAIQAKISGEFFDMDKLVELLPNDLRYLIDCLAFLRKTQEDIPEELDCFTSHYFKAIALEKLGNPNCQVEFEKCSEHFPKFKHITDDQLKNGQVLSILDEAIKENESSFVLRCQRANKCLDFISNEPNLPNKKQLYEIALKDLEYVSEFISFPLLFTITCRLCYMLSEEKNDFGFNWIQLCMIIIQSNDTSLLKISAQIMLNTGKVSMAILLLSKGIEIEDDQLSELLEIRAQSFYNQGNYLEGENNFRRLIELSPSNANYYKYCAYAIFAQEKESIYYSQTRSEEAIQLLSKYIFSHPDDKSAIIQRIFIHLFMFSKSLDRQFLILAAKDAILINHQEAILTISGIDPSVFKDVL